MVAIGALLDIWQLFIFAAAISVFFAFAYVMTPSKVDISVTRNVLKSPEVDGELLSVSLEIKNQGDYVPMVEVVDRQPDNTVLVSGSNRVIFPLGNGKNKKINYVLKLPYRGEYTVGPVDVRVSDVWMMEFTEMTFGTTWGFHVMPRTEELRRSKIRPAYLRNWAGFMQSRRLGQGSEFDSLRDYVPGDEMKHINWKASARTGRMVSNQYQSERSGDFVIIVDARNEAGGRDRRNIAIEAGLRAALSLTSRILHEKNRVGLVTTGEYLDWVYPAYGRGQYFKIADKLTHLASGGSWTIDYLKWVLTRFFPAKTQLIIISPLLDRRVIDIVIELRSGGFPMVIISPSSLSNAFGSSLSGEEAQMAKSFLDMERDLVISELRQYAQVVDWDIGNPLEAALLEVRRIER